MNIPSPISELKFDLLKQQNISLCLKRDDLIHPHISGNKWRKLKYNMLAAKQHKSTEIITFGGAYSNHIVATAAAGKINGIATRGIIRGDSFTKNDSLDFAQECGMKLEYISRTAYREKENYIAALKDKYPHAWIVPEGGANAEGVLGCSEIYEELDDRYDYICCAAGTGTTAAGLINSVNKEQVIVFPALKNARFLAEEIKRLSGKSTLPQLKLILEYHFGGYAKINAELRKFYMEFNEVQGIELDLIYNSKMMFGLLDMLSKGYFPSGSKILALHTGGVQGNKSLLESKKLLKPNC